MEFVLWIGIGDEYLWIGIGKKGILQLIGIHPNELVWIDEMGYAVNIVIVLQEITNIMM